MDLAKIERVHTIEFEFNQGRAAPGERSINKLLSEGWVIVTSKVVQCGNAENGYYGQLCVVMGKPKPRKMMSQEEFDRNSGARE